MNDASIIPATDPSKRTALRLSVDFGGQNLFRNPAAEVEKLRAAGPVVEIELPMLGRVWAATTQETAGRVLKDGELFTLRRDDGSIPGLRWWMPRILLVFTNNMLNADEPDHTRLRELVDEAFRRRAVIEMEPRIRAIADQLAGDLFAQGAPADLVTRYARTLPLSAICELLGLPPADRAKFATWAGRVTGASGPLGFWRAAPALAAMKRYLEQRLEEARSARGEGLIAELVRVEKHGARLSRDEMVAMVFLLLLAGHETTTHLISGSVFELARTPGLRDWLRQDWSRANLAVEELLRFVSPVQFSKPRFVRRDVVLGGVPLKRGDQIMALLVAANMDPAANETPEKLDLARRPNHHIAFGMGIHFCLGHQLARLEGKCALQALYPRWPDLALAVRPEQIRWRNRPGLRAITSLPVAPSPTSDKI
jgi:cytochrome P450